MNPILFILLIPLYVSYFVAAVLLAMDFIHFMLRGVHMFGKLYKAIEMIIVWTVLASLYLNTTNTNECCNGFTLFSPVYGLSIYVLIGPVTIAYFYSSYRTRIAPPITETILNCLFLMGCVFNVLVAVQLNDSFLIVFFSVPVAILLIFALIRNHQLLLAAVEEPEGMGLLARFCRELLLLRPIQKIPILLVLCLPLIVLVGAVLLVFGQKPDSLVRAFTDTYHYGFSQLEKECDRVSCGGVHFLCTIAAKGHAPLVRPFRFGVRGGRRIICNRQLLVSNMPLKNGYRSIFRLYIGR